MLTDRLTSHANAGAKPGGGELPALATTLLKSYPELDFEDLSFHLIEARGRIVPEMDDKPGERVVDSLERRGARDSALIVWTAGNAADPDVHTVPNAQHAVRQAKRPAKNIVASLRAGRVRSYRHDSLGAVPTLGLGRGIFQYERIVIKGFPAWLMHRGYHALTVPTWERKARILAVWLTAALFGRDLVSPFSVQHPRDAFVTSSDPERANAARATDRTA